eukprot:scaffold5454_cov176-Amphora_coffeaeformis.AAC.3
MPRKTNLESVDDDRSNVRKCNKQCPSIVRSQAGRFGRLTLAQHSFGMDFRVEKNGQATLVVTNEVRYFVCRKFVVFGKIMIHGGDGTMVELIDSSKYSALCCVRC